MKNKYLIQLVSKFLKLAVPLESDYIEDIFSEPMRATIPADREMIVYHGTSTTKLKKIIMSGSLNPSIETAEKSYAESSPGVFITTKIHGMMNSAEHYAHHASKVSGGDPIILELYVPFGWIEMDPDDTRILEESMERNEAGKVQGRILNNIPLNRIIKVWTVPSILGGEAAQSFSLRDFANKISEEETQDIKRQLSSRAPEMLVREPSIDLESKLADILTQWHDNIYPPYQVGKNKLTAYDNALIIAFNYKFKNAKSALEEYCNLMGNDISQIEGYPAEYIPKPHESLRMFLTRYSRS